MRIRCLKIENENCEPRNYSRYYFLDNLLTAIDSHCVDVMRLFVFALLACQCHVRTSLSQNRVRSLCSLQCERARFKYVWQIRDIARYYILPPGFVIIRNKTFLLVFFVFCLFRLFSFVLVLLKKDVETMTQE